MTSMPLEEDDDDAVLALAIHSSVVHATDRTSLKRSYSVHAEEEDADLARAIHLSAMETPTFLSSEQEDEQLAVALQTSALESSPPPLHKEESDVALAVQSSVDQTRLEEDRDRKEAESILMEGSARLTAAHANSERNAGSWDCQTCTFTNEPYAKECAICKAASPDHVLSFENMSDLRFGLEIEMVIPDGKRDGFTLDRIAQDLTRIGPPRVDFCGYSHETTPYWKIVTDSSVRGSSGDNDLCFELVSPVLQGPEGLSSLRYIMEHVRRLGVSTNASCGFHVHVDATSGKKQAVPEMGTLDGLRRVSQCFVALENAFNLLVALTWDNCDAHRRGNKNEYCGSNRLCFGSRTNRQRWEKIGSAGTLSKLVKIMNPGGDRYKKLNLTNITKRSRPSTCEFRHHGGVEELREAEAWVRLILRFCERASQGYGSCLLPEEYRPKDEFRALFELVNCDGLEQFFVVERKLFHGLRNEWECQVCKRSFQNSRALAQHTRDRH